MMNCTCNGAMIFEDEQQYKKVSCIQCGNVINNRKRNMYCSEECCIKYLKEHSLLRNDNIDPDKIKLPESIKDILCMEYIPLNADSILRR